jgi:hypothetical protein
VSKANLPSSVVTTTQLAAKRPRGVVFTPEQFGAKGDLTVFYDGAIQAGSTTLTSAAFTSASLLGGAGSKNLYVNWAGAGTSGGATSAALSTGVAITSIPRTSGAAIPLGPLLITSGTHAQLFNVTTAATANAAITVSSAIPIFAFPLSSALSFANAGFTTTVQSVASGSATLPAAASSTVQNMVGWFGTDDSAAFNSMRAAILAAGGGTELLLNTGYLLDGTPLTTSGGNSIVPFPLLSAGTLATFGSAGTSPASSAYSYVNDEVNGTVIATTRISDTYSATHGAPSIMGGPTTETAGNQIPQIAMVLMEDMTFLKPENPSIGTVDCALVARTEHRRVYSKTAAQINRGAYNFTATAGGGYAAMGQVPSHAWSFGFWLPDTLNYNASIVDNCGAVGELAAYVTSAHTEFRNSWAQFCAAAIVANDGQGRSIGVHLNRLGRFGVFACNYGFSGWDASAGLRSLNASSNAETFEGSVSWELDGNQWGQNQPSLDVNGRLQGDIISHAYTSAFGPIPSPISSPGLRWRDVVSVPLSYDDVILADTPLAYIKLAETSGTAAADSSGNGHAGTHTAAPLLGLDAPFGGAGGAVAYNGSSQYTTLDVLGTLGANLGSSTTETWLKATSTAAKAIMGVISSSSGSQYDITANTPSAGKTQIEVKDNAGNARTGNFTAGIYDGNWHHIIIEPSTTGVHTVYADGVPQTVTMTVTGTLTTMSAFTLGMALGAENINSFGPVNEYACRLSRVAFYLSQLSQARVATHYITAQRK